MPDPADGVRRILATSAERPDGLVAQFDTRTNQEWLADEPRIHEATVRAVNTLPEMTPNTAAAITRRVAQRLGDSADIAHTIMEAVIRGAAGDHDAAASVPPNVALVYSVMVVGQLVHDGRLTLDEALAGDERAEASVHELRRTTNDG